MIRVKLSEKWDFTSFTEASLPRCYGDTVLYPSLRDDLVTLMSWVGTLVFGIT